MGKASVPCQSFVEAFETHACKTVSVPEVEWNEAKHHQIWMETVLFEFSMSDYVEMGN